MSIESSVLAIGLAAAVLATAGAAFAGPGITRENREQVAFAVQEQKSPLTGAAAARFRAELKQPGAFGAPGPYYLNEAPFSSENPHRGAAQDATDE